MNQNLELTYHILFAGFISFILLSLAGYLLSTKTASKISKLTELHPEQTVVTLFVIISSIIYFLIYHINYTNILK